MKGVQLFFLCAFGIHLIFLGPLVGCSFYFEIISLRLTLSARVTARDT
jgi:hypothetical protein